MYLEGDTDSTNRELITNGNFRERSLLGEFKLSVFQKIAKSLLSLAHDSVDVE